MSRELQEHQIDEAFAGLVEARADLALAVKGCGDCGDRPDLCDRCDYYRRRAEKKVRLFENELAVAENDASFLPSV